MKLHKLLFCVSAFALVAAAQTQAPRSLCLFFDLNSMSAPDQARAQESAIRFVQEQMTSADVVSIMAFGSDVKVLQDFTGNRDALVAALRSLMPGADSAAAAADQSRSLEGIRTAAMLLEPVAGKKAMLYFTGGPTNNLTPRDQFTAVINAAVRANLAIYPVDVRGLATDKLLLR